MRDECILEVGCGHGQWFSAFEAFGANPGNLAGIELDPQRAKICQQRSPFADIRTGDVCKLPWEDQHFDLVFQSTVFTSILDAKVKRILAFEMLRVLKPGGQVLWYDFRFNNPKNPNVRGVSRREISGLFPNCTMKFWRTTLAPPIARFLVPKSLFLAEVLERLKLFNTHLFGCFQKRDVRRN